MSHLTDLAIPLQGREVCLTSTWRGWVGNAKYTEVQGMRKQVLVAPYSSDLPSLKDPFLRSVPAYSFTYSVASSTSSSDH